MDTLSWDKAPKLQMGVLCSYIGCFMLLYKGPVFGALSWDNIPIFQGLPGVGVFRCKPRFDPAGVETPADPAGVGVKIFSGVKSPPGSG